MQLKGKVALVTGAGSGIGQAIAHAFARQGARVGVADIDADAAARTAAAITSGGGEAIALTMDVTDEKAVDEGTNRLAARFGGLDIAVANAGIQIVHPVEEFPLDEFRRVVDIHLTGAFLTTRAAVRHMYPAGSGSLIYMGSVHSHDASPLKSAYVAAKHGILGLARVMAKEGAPHGVRSNVICPGFVRTPLVDKQIPEQARDLGISEERVVKEVMLGRTVTGEFTTLEDVADTAVFLAGFGSRALTGQSLLVSNGWVMK
ncbi:3-hydroxybutyrate dehydrogenase [Erythrobacteraceae bacterium CFH 75059]|uniref:3-hydroxybutyrate dehydrogenase n=1 Tax=Qipengyuania thermophila TaxID=2509361 RepID=UPI00101E8ACA|nr:3-hydroxybutyrate dehydrogenase [Qipengyuania thermophila]TCD06504.1 3-hydroxybutyrate dehydrogenase [Erythrobacteraceae bacterium CFH 75059]